MTKVRDSGPRSYAARLAGARLPAKPAEAQAAKVKAPLEPGLAPTRPLAGGAAAPADVFAAAHVPEKIAAKHGPALRGAIAELAQLGAFAAQLEGHREKQLARTLEQLHKVLGGVLERVEPAAARTEVAARTFAAAHRLATVIGPNELLVPALTAAVGLVDAASRLEGKKKLALGAEGAKTAMEEAAAAVEGLATRLTGRRGVSSALNVFAPLVEQLELSYAKLDRAGVAGLTEAAARFLAEATPSEGLDLTTVASLAERVARTSKATPGDATRALEAAKAELVAERRDLVTQARAGLGEAPATASPPFDEARRATEAAIARALDASPVASDALLAAADALRAAVARPSLVPRPVRPGGPVNTPAVTHVLSGLAPALAKVAGTPLDAPLMQLAAERMDAFAAQPAAHGVLLRAANAATLHDVADALITAEHAVRTRGAQLPPDLQQSLAALRELPETTALQVTLALLPQLRLGRGDAALLDGLTRYAKAARPDQPLAAFGQFAVRWSEVAARLAAYPALAPERAQVLERITLGTVGSAVDPAQLYLVLLSAQLAKQYLPLTSPSALLVRDLSGGPGLLEPLDGRARYGTPLNEVYAPLVQGAQAKVKNDKALQEELAPLAVKVALEAAKIVGGKGLHTKRITADWTTAVTSPEKLQYAARGQGAAALRAQQQPSVAQFFAAHPELPPDLALTAGLHLSPDQLAWVTARIAASHGRDTVRMLRDFVFACVEAAKLDLVEAARTSPSPSKAISAAITRVAQSYRNNELGKIPFDALAEGLRAGGDPELELAAAQTKEALAALKLDALVPGKVSEAGLRELTSISANVADLLAQYTPGFKSSLDGEIDMGALRPIFLACLGSVLDGTWPAPKYENEAGKRIMAALSPAQQAVWREPMITSAKAAAAPEASEALRGALQLAKGLRRAIPEEVKLPAGALGKLGFDAASAERLRAKQVELLEGLRNAEKGSAAHRDASKALGPVATSLAVVELHLALEAQLGDAPGATPREALLALRPQLEAAQAALKKLGGRGSSEAVGEILGALRDLDTAPVRTGRYAADEDGLAAMIDSHKTGCLSFGDKRRRWGLAGALADANIRMVRAYDGDKQRYRAFLKFFPVELPDYKGPALWVDAPRPDGGGGAEDLALVWKHVYAKAAAMGVPVMSARVEQLPAGWTQKNAVATFSIDDGNTGYMHSDSLFGGKGSIRTSRGANPVWTVAKNVSVALPPA